MVVKSLVVVGKGEEVSDNYGPVYYFKNKEDRQKELKARYTHINNQKQRIQLMEQNGNNYPALHYYLFMLYDYQTLLREKKVFFK